MAAGDIVPVPGDSFEQTLASASPDVLREMVREFAADDGCRGRGPVRRGLREVTPGRVNSRNGCRRREWDTRAGTEAVAFSTRARRWQGRAVEDGLIGRWRSISAGRTKISSSCFLWICGNGFLMITWCGPCSRSLTAWTSPGWRPGMRLVAWAGRPTIRGCSWRC